MESSREVRTLKDIRGQIEGRDVLVVEVQHPVGDADRVNGHSTCAGTLPRHLAG